MASSRHPGARPASHRRVGWRWSGRDWFGRGRTRALLCLAVIGSLAYTTSTAFWTDEVQVSGTSFTSGTLDLVVNDADPYLGATQLSMTGMVPGNTSAQVLTV